MRPGEILLFEVMGRTDRRCFPIGPRPFIWIPSMQGPSANPPSQPRSKPAAPPGASDARWRQAIAPATCAHPALASFILVGLLFLVAFAHARREGGVDLGSAQVQPSAGSSHPLPEPSK